MPVDATTPIHQAHIIEVGSSYEQYVGRVDNPDPSKSEAEAETFILPLLWPSYSPLTVQRFLEDLSSTTTDFKTLTNLSHFCDRSSVIALTQYYSCTLLRAPPRYGKTSIVSMLSYFYDVRHKDDFAYAFRYSEDMSTWMPNNHYVLKLEFGSLDVKSQDFNLNDELNKALEDFVKQYSLLPEGKEWKELEDKDPVTTLSNVMSVTRPRKHGLVVLVDDYDSPFWAAYEFPDKRDEIKRSLYKFFGALLCWKRCQVISVIFFTGTQQILSTVSEATWEEAHDIVVQEDTDKLAGFCREDVFYIANVMQWTFHGLRLAELADEFLESEEAKEQLEQGAGWYEFSCHTVLDFFHKRLAEKGKAVTGYVPLRTEQRIVNSPIFP